VEDLQKDETTGVYKDASGKEIGYDRKENDDGSWSTLRPSDTSARTGEITAYYEYGEDKDGNWYNVSYDRNMKLSSKYVESEDADGNPVSTYYNSDDTVSYYRVTDDEGRTTWYTADGEKMYSVEDESYRNGIAQHKTDYYNEKDELVYSRIDSVSDGYRSHTVYLDAEGNVIAEGDVNFDNGDYLSKYPETTYAQHIIGYYENGSKDNGKTQIQREYDADNQLISERIRTTEVEQTDDTVTRTVTDGAGKTVSVRAEERDQDNNTTRATVTYFSRYDGSVNSKVKQYYLDGYTAEKTYDENGNVTNYGYEWDNDDWHYQDSYWVNGNQSSYSWSDNLNEQGNYESSYYPEGMISYERYIDGNGYSYSRNYNKAGALTFNSETTDGVTNVTYYDKDGNITGYDWNGTSHWDGGKYEGDSTVWDANQVIYTRHSEDEPDGTRTETWTDPNGNVKVMGGNGTTVTFADTTDGWKLAFGREWYYLEGGKPVTGWKAIGGVWYYFYGDGEMATTMVTDSNGTKYAMNKDGAWTEAGWNLDANGNYSYVEGGNVVTGWKLIDGKWYYFDDGWRLNEDPWYDNDDLWYKVTEGRMVKGAFDVWNGDWSDTTTYFFNEDGSWDTTPGWKSDGIDWYYFSKGGDRAIGWKKIDGEWYYFNQKGIMRNGWVGENGYWYYLNENGDMADGEWIQERFEDTWYYADKGGLMATGWRDINDTWYYFNENGDMASEQWVQSGNTWYYMNKNGDMATGWAQDDDTWYYMDETGAMQTGWVQLGGVWYYLDANGAMVTGQQTIDGVVSNFDASGAWLGYAE
jgi:glucan-binding YG repeat protein